MTRAFVLLVLLILQGTLIALLVSADWVEHQCALEREHLQLYVGASREGHIEQRALAVYRRWIVETGVSSRSYDQLLPDRSVVQYGMEGLAPWFFKWLERRLDAFWWLVFLAIYRAQVLWEWLPYVTALAVVTTLDGMLKRQIRRVSAGYASADRYTFARGTLVFLGFVPFLYLSLPLSVNPIFVPALGALVAFAMGVLAANAQHEL